MVAIQRQTRARAYLYGLLIEGVGDDLTPSGGAIFCMGRAPRTTSAIYASYEWIPSLIRAPDSVGVSVDTITGAISAESMSFEVANSARAASLIMAYQATPAGLVLDDRGTELDIDNVSLSPDQIIWSGDEAVSIVSLGSLVTGGRTYNVDRAWFDTTQATDLTGSYVYEGRTPYLRYRACRLVRYDPIADTLTTIDRGYIDRIGTSANGLAITIDAPSLISLINGAKVNRDAPKIQHVTDEGRRIGPVLVTQVSGYTERIARENLAVLQFRYFQVGDIVSTGLAYSGGSVVGDIAQTKLFESPWPDASGDDFEHPGDDFYQLFVVKSDDQATSSTVDLGPSADRVTYQLWRHAYAIPLGFLRSGAPDRLADSWSTWSGTWGVGLPADMIDVADWYNVIKATPDALIDQMALGWGGDEVDITAYIVRLLRAYGAILAPKADGTLTIKRVALATIDDYIGAPVVDALPPRMEIDPAIEKAYTTVRAEIGELPWTKPDIVTVEARTGEGADSLRRAVLDASRQITFDFSTMRAGSDLTPDLISIATQGLERSPRITVDVAVAELTGAAYDIGGWVRVTGPDVSDDYLVDRFFQRTRLASDDPAHIGRIVGRRHIVDPPKVELVLELTNFRAGNFARWRAPAGIILDNIIDAGGGVYYILLEDNVFHAGALDASYFTVGDFISIDGPDGASFSFPTMTIINIAGSTLTVDATSPLSSLALVGWIVRLADRSTYGIGGDPTGAGIRAYAYIEGNVNPETDIYG